MVMTCYLQSLIRYVSTTTLYCYTDAYILVIIWPPFFHYSDCSLTFISSNLC
uniref:Uncharacterized protein n=1 Tax=Arundo donax TaxID=35708 RepID=A0A0A9HME3_ARUDO